MARLAERLRRGERLLGMFHALPDPALVELSAQAGFDVIVIECEHGLRDLESVQRQIVMAERYGMETIVRIGRHDLGVLPRFLDAGAAGVMVAHVTSAADAEAVVKAARFPPYGERGMGYRRAAPRLGANQQAFADADADTVVLAIVEDVAGVDRIDEIVAVPGLSGVSPGGGDLALSQGLVLDSGTHPVVSEQLERVRAAARGRGLWTLELLLGGVSGIPAAVERGANLMIFGLDSMLIADLFGSIARDARGIVAGLEEKSR